MLLLALVGVGAGEIALRPASGPAPALAEGLEARYYLVLRYGSDLEVCVQARLVAAAYLEAGDDARYTLWAETARDDCERAQGAEGG